MAKFEIYQRKDNDWGFRIKRKGRIITWSEGYSTKSNATRALISFLMGIKKALEKSPSIEEFKKCIRYIKYTETQK